MDRKQIVRWALGLTAVGVAMALMPSVAFAQEAAGAAAEKATFLTTHGAGWLGGRIDGAAACGGRSDFDGHDYHGGDDRRCDALRGRCRSVGGTEGCVVRF